MLKTDVKDCHSPGCYRQAYQWPGTAYSKFCHLCTLWFSNYLIQRKNGPAQQEALTCYARDIKNCVNYAQKNSKFCSTCTHFLCAKNKKISTPAQSAEDRCCAPFCANTPELEIGGIRCICVPCYVYLHKNIDAWTSPLNCCVELCSNKAVVECSRMCVACYTFMDSVHSDILAQETSCFEILDTTGSYDVPCSFGPCSSVFCKYWVLPKENDGRCIHCYKKFVDNKLLEVRMQNSAALFHRHRCCDLEVRCLDRESNERINR
jgi:hypothetical protein